MTTDKNVYVFELIKGLQYETVHLHKRSFTPLNTTDLSFFRVSPLCTEVSVHNDPFTIGSSNIESEPLLAIVFTAKKCLYFTPGFID